MPAGKTLALLQGTIALSILASCGEPAVKAPSPAVPDPEPEAHLQGVEWSQIPEWDELDPVPGLQAFRISCRAIKSKAPWSKACAQADAHAGTDAKSVRELFERNFMPHRAVDGSKVTGRLTGYFEPLLRGSRVRTERYRHPLYRPPSDLIHPNHPDSHYLKDKSGRGRIVNGSFVPYMTRAEIDGTPDLMEKHAFLWVDSLGDRFFLHIQGSGRVLLENGTIVRVGYANHNGHKFVSLANHLIKSGELARSEASMNGIKAFLALNEGRAHEFLAVNPRYIFFQELPPSSEGPIGALGVPLTALHSIAVDRRHVQLGAPAVISTKGFDAAHTFTRLVAAQDVGGAIKGKIRADYFWGYGNEAGRLAESTNQQFSAWYLLPRK